MGHSRAPRSTRAPRRVAVRVPAWGVPPGPRPERDGGGAAWDALSLGRGRSGRAGPPRHVDPQRGCVRLGKREGQALLHLAAPCLGSLTPSTLPPPPADTMTWAELALQGPQPQPQPQERSLVAASCAPLLSGDGPDGRVRIRALSPPTMPSTAAAGTERLNWARLACVGAQVLVFGGRGGAVDGAPGGAVLMDVGAWSGHGGRTPDAPAVPCACCGGRWGGARLTHECPPPSRPGGHPLHATQVLARGAAAPRPGGGEWPDAAGK